MVRKTIPMLVILALAQLPTVAQEAVSSGGGYLQTGEGSVSATIGEPVNETFSGSTGTLTQGMQQPSVVVNLPDGINQALGISVEVYPNPVSEQLKILAGVPGAIQYVLTNRAGVQAASGTFDGETLIDVAPLPGGIYNLVLTQNGQVQSVEIVKQ